jgi:hypothetical protein
MPLRWMTDDELQAVRRELEIEAQRRAQDLADAECARDEAEHAVTAIIRARQEAHDTGDQKTLRRTVGKTKEARIQAIELQRAITPFVEARDKALWDAQAVGQYTTLHQERINASTNSDRAHMRLLMAPCTGHPQGFHQLWIDTGWTHGERSIGVSCLNCQGRVYMAQSLAIQWVLTDMVQRRMIPDLPPTAVTIHGALGKPSRAALGQCPECGEWGGQPVFVGMYQCGACGHQW